MKKLLMAICCMALMVLAGVAEATQEKQEILRIEPNFNLKEWVPHLFPFKHEQDSERMMELLRKAGLPK